MRPVRRRARERLPRLVLVTLAVCVCLAAPVAAAPSRARGATAPPTRPAAAKHVPVLAYFYQWFNSASWNRAKIDFRLVGNYSSDDPHVLREQISTARSAGTDGFLTSWKDTPTLDRRLSLLIRVAQDYHLDLGVVYEALDFTRTRCRSPRCARTWSIWSRPGEPGCGPGTSGGR